MKSRYNDSEIEQSLLIISPLDPRFKSLPQLDNIQREEPHDVIVQKQRNVQSHIKTEPVEDDTPQPEPLLRHCPTLNLLQSTLQSSSSQDSGPDDAFSYGTGSSIKNLFCDVFITSTEQVSKTPLDVVTSEVRSYLSEPTPPLDCNPLKW